MFVPVTPALIAEEQHQVLSESSVHYLRLCEINGPVRDRLLQGKKISTP